VPFFTGNRKLSGEILQGYRLQSRIFRQDGFRCGDKGGNRVWQAWTSLRGSASTHPLGNPQDGCVTAMKKEKIPTGNEVE